MSLICNTPKHVTSFCSRNCTRFYCNPSIGLFHVGVQYSPTCFGLDGLTLAFTVDNLFDKNYCDYSTYGTAYWPGAGRCYMFTVRYEF